MLRVEDSLKFLIYLGKIIGGAAGTAIASVAMGDSSKLDELSSNSFNFEKLGSNLSILLSRIEEEETIEKINLLLKSVSHGGNILHVNYLLFDNGRLDLLFKIIKEAFTHNYRNFFYANNGILDRLKKTSELITKSLRPSENQT